jgi:hypothetical protein
MNITQMHFLANVNQCLQEMVGAAAKDYVMVSELLKRGYNSRTSIGTDEKVETLIADLQYMDIFCQRVEHLIETHNKMINEDLAENFSESFYHLQVCQAMTIEMDWLRSIANIKNTLQEIKAEFIVKQTQWLDGDLFGNTVFIKAILRKTIDELLQAGGEAKHLPIPTLTPDQVRVLQSLYTMESERLVLNWFLNYMPGGTWEDLLKYYEVEISHVGADNTELF